MTFKYVDLAEIYTIFSLSKQIDSISLVAAICAFFKGRMQQFDW